MIKKKKSLGNIWFLTKKTVESLVSYKTYALNVKFYKHKTTFSYFISSFSSIVSTWLGKS